MAEENKRVNFDILTDKQKVNFIKNLLFNRDLEDAIGTLMKYEKKDLRVTDKIVESLNDRLIVKRIREQCNLRHMYPKIYVYSKIISILAFYNKPVILNNLFRSFDEATLKQIAFFEYQNNTNTSIENNIFKKYCSKYEKEARESARIDEKTILLLTMEYKKFNLLSKEERNKKNTPKIILIIVLVLFIVAFAYFMYDSGKLISKYDNLVYPGIYLNDIDLSGKKISELDQILKNKKENIEKGKFVIKNINGEYEYSYNDANVKINDNKVLKEIKKYNKNLSLFRKMILVRSKKRYKTFYLKGEIDNIDGFITNIENIVNCEPKNDGLVIDSEHNVTYSKGQKGFILDKTKFNKDINIKLNNLDKKTTILAEGKVTENEINNPLLQTIDTKITSFTTYFANTGNRGHNIVLASSKLNDTLLMPGDTFSYLSVVGPYNGTNGYRPAPVYVAGILSTANGGGVCQLASTLYNAQLRAGLETVYRTNHTYAPTYVPMGLDATVSGTWPDYKFKNQYDYPFYIVSYVKGNYVTVDIWSNKDALDGKVFEPYSVYSNGGYSAYLKISKNGEVIETKYLDRSVYRAH